MDTLTVIIIGIYLFLESFTAVNEMPKIKLRELFCELKSIYTLKYIGIGLYGLSIVYYASFIKGWQVLLILPAVFCVIERTIFRLHNNTLPMLQYVLERFNRKHKAK